MNGDYLVIDKKVLPEVYEKVIATKKDFTRRQS